MKYTIVVDKQPRANPSSEIRKYTIEIDELLQQGDVFDELIIARTEDYVIRRLYMTPYYVVSVLAEEVREDIPDINIELFDGVNYIYLENEEGNYITAEYIMSNDFTETYVTEAQMNSAISITSQDILLSVNEKLLSDYSTTAETQAMIKVSSDNITSKVSSIETIANTNENNITNINKNLSNLDTTTKNLTNNVKTIETRTSSLEQTVEGFDFNIVSEIQQQLANGTVTSNEVKTTSVTIDQDGIKVAKSDSEMQSLFDNEGLYVNKGEIDKSDDKNNILTVDKDGVVTENLYVRTYATLGYHRFEGYIENGEHRTGVFYQGGVES